MTAASKQLDASVAALEGMSLDGLREVWRAHYGSPPTLRSPELLALMLAWRLQADQTKGLDPETRRQLRRPPSEPVKPLVAIGTRLVREWQGVPHEVTAISDGYIYAGRHFDSLSQIARLITGTRWNGPLFFGLRKAA